MQKECESDALLIQLVKLRLIVERINDLHWLGDYPGADAPTKAPAVFYIKSIETQIQDFKSNIPIEVSNNSESLLYQS